jgi:5-hydroxyisourate hydrolase-like protein (transthyretin family)
MQKLLNRIPTPPFILLNIALFLASNVSQAFAIQGTAKDKQPNFTLELNIGTFDGKETERPYLLYTYVPVGRKTEKTTSANVNTKNSRQEFILPANTSQVVIVSDNYAPELVQFDQPASAGEKVKRSVNLVAGIKKTIRIVDENGNPISKTRLMPQVEFENHANTRWRAQSTDSNGETTFRFPLNFTVGKISASKSNHTRGSVEVTPGKNEYSVTLESHQKFTVQILDHEGKPVPNANVYHMNRGSQFTNRERKNTLFRTDAEGKFEVLTDRKRPYIQSLMIERGRSYNIKQRGFFADIHLQTDAVNELRLSEPRTLTFNLKGDTSLLKGKSLRLSNGFYDRSGHQYFMLIPYRFNRDRNVMTVHGVLDGWVALSLQNTPGNLFNSNEIQYEEATEFDIELSRIKTHTRKLRFAFEHDGEKVEPEGKLTFYAKGSNTSSKKMEPSILKGIAEVTAEFKDQINHLRVKSDGMRGYCIDPEDAGDIKIKLTPLTELDSNKVQTCVIPVVPAGRIAGMIRTFDGQPFTGRLSFKSKYIDGRHGPYGIQRSVSSDSQGNFELTPIPLGCDVEMEIEKLGCELKRTFRISSELATLKPEVLLPETKPASITVLLPSGKPAQRAPIKLYRTPSTGHSRSFSLRTDSLGQLEIPNLSLSYPGEYSISIHSKGELQRVLKRRIRPGDNLTIKLKAGYKLTGKVVNKTGIPIARMRVEAIDENDVTVDWAYTDHKGNFSLKSLPDGQVRLRAKHATGADVKVELTKPIPTNQKKKIELKAIDKRKFESASRLTTLQNRLSA